MKVKVMLVAVLVCLALTKVTPGEELQIGETVKSFIKKKVGGQSIIMVNANQIQPEQYLFFSVALQLDEQWKNVKMTISKKSEKGLILNCQNTIIDNCYIKGDQLTQNDILKVKVQCQGPCHFQFGTHWIPIQKIGVNESIPFTFTSVSVGHFFEFLGDNLSGRLKFIIEPKETKSIIDRLQIIGSTNGQLPTRMNHNIESVPLWGKGHGIFINNANINGKLLLLVLGESGVNYTLKCVQSIQEFKQLALAQPDHDFLPIQAVHKFEIPLSYNESDNLQEFYCIDIKIFLGQVTIGFFIDRNLQNIFQVKPILFRGSSRYIFTKKDLIKNKIKSLYGTLQSAGNPTTYSIQVVKEYLNEATELKHNLYEFIEVNEKKLLYIKLNQWNFHIAEDPQDIVVNVLNVGNNTQHPTFRICQKTIHQCTSKKIFETSTKVIANVKSETLDKQTLYRITLNPKVYFNLLANTQSNAIIIQLDVNTNDQPNFVVMFYSDQNQIYPLEKGIRTQVAIQTGTTKLFYFNPQPNIVQARVYCILVNGEIVIKSARKDPRRNPQVEFIEHDINYIVFDYNLSEPIFLQVNGFSEATFVLVAQTTSLQQEFLNDDLTESLPLIEDKQYSFILNAGDEQIFLLKPKIEGITIRYDSTGAVSVCLVANPQEICGSQQQYIGNKKELYYSTGIAQYYLRYVNTNQRKAVQSSLRFHSGPQVECLENKIGKLYSDLVEDNFCAEYILENTIETLQGSFIRTQMQRLALNVELCGSPLELKGVRFEISSNTISQKCKDGKQISLKVFLSKQDKNNQKMKVQYVVKVKDQPLELPDGLGHMELLKSAPGIAKKYYYYLLNKINTQVLIHNKLGGVVAYMKIVEENEQKNTIVTNTDFDIATQDSFLYLSGPQVTIHQNYLSTLSCHNCVLVIVTYPESSLATGDDIAYTIEVTQNTVLLNEHQIHASFLEKGSVKYFRYECLSENSTLMFDVSNQHMECTRLYVSNIEYPSESNKLDMVWGNEISIDCKYRNYYLAVQAIQDCPIQVVAQSTNFKLTKIRGGMPIQFNLKENQVQYFTYLHATDVNFKVLNLQKYGDVQIYLNEATPEVIKMITGPVNTLSFKNFQFSSTLKNIVTVNKDNSNYCVHCIYLIAVIGQSTLVDSSILVLDNPNHPILMSPEKMIYDELQVNETVNLEYFDLLNGKVSVNVYRGTVQLKIKYLEKQLKFDLNAQNDNQVYKFDFIDPSVNYDWDPIIFSVKNSGEGLAEYSLFVSKENDPQSNAYLMKSGVITYVSLKASDTYCIRGYFSGSKERVHLSIQRSNQQMLGKIQLAVIVNDKPTPVTPKIIQNIMEIEINSILTGQTKFMICLENTADIRMILNVIQSGKINQLVENQLQISRGQQIFTIRPKTQALFDIFTCKGEVQYLLDTSYQGLQTSEKSMITLDQIGKVSNTGNQNNHVVYYETKQQQVFLKLKSEESLVKWLQVDESRQMGVGYGKYEVGQMSENILSDQVQLIWQPLRPKTNTMLKIASVRYRLFIAKSPVEAKMAANCQLLADAQFFVIQTQLNETEHQNLLNQHNTILINVEKKQIRESFKQTSNNQDILNLYITLSADAQMQVPNSNILESYRFVYNNIQLPRTLILNDGQVQDKSNKIVLLVGGITISIVGVVLVTYLVLKKFAPLVSRLKNRMFVQEQVRNGDSAPSVDMAGNNSDKKIVVDQEI